MFTRPTDLPPATELSTDQLAHQLCHHLLNGPTSTRLYHEAMVDDDIGIPRSWLIASHKAARRRRPNDDGTAHMTYHEHSDAEILASLSVKLEFDLEACKTATQNGNDRVVLAAIYDGLRDLPPTVDERDGAPWPGFHQA